MSRNTNLDQSGYLVTNKNIDDKSKYKSSYTSGRGTNKKHPEFKLWIYDLLNINLSTKPDKKTLYDFRGLIVNVVDIYGVVSGVFPNRFGILYKVDDGTGEIGCWHDNRNIIKKEDLKNKVKKCMSEILENMNSADEEEPNCSFFTSTSHIDDGESSASLQVAQWMEKQILEYAESGKDSYELGDSVHLRGKLIDFRGERNIRIYKIRQVFDINEETDRRFELVYLYETFYSRQTKK